MAYANNPDTKYEPSAIARESWDCSVSLATDAGGDG